MVFGASPSPLHGSASIVCKPGCVLVGRPVTEFLTWGVIVLSLVFVAEAIYALFFRDFGLVSFRIALNVPGTDARTVWATYFDERNEWNSLTERLSYEVLSETPRMVRIRTRWRGSSDEPAAMTVRVDVTAPGRTARITTVAVGSADLSGKDQVYEVFEVTPGEHGADVRVEAAIPVKGWFTKPLHQRNLERIYQDLRIACLQKSGVPFRVETRPSWRRA